MAKKFHSEAEAEVYGINKVIIDRDHHNLRETEFQILYKHGGWESKGKTIFAKIKVLPDDMRRLLRKDVILYLNADMWKVMTSPQRNYVIDHALYTIMPREDKHGQVVRDADGRPKLTTCLPDIEGFVDVIKRHGPIAEDVKRLALALRETNQLTFDDIAKEAEEGAEKPEEPRDGVRGKIDKSGVVDVDSEYDERNQVTIEQVAASAESEGAGPEGDMSEVPPIEDDNLPW